MQLSERAKMSLANSLKKLPPEKRAAYLDAMKDHAKKCWAAKNQTASQSVGKTTTAN